MALSVTPNGSGTSSTFTPIAGSDRFVCIEWRAETGSTVTLDAATYGPAGPAAHRIESRPLSGNQMFCHYAWFDEADVAARTSDVITPTWSGSTPTTTIYVQQWNNVDQGLPINDLVEASNSVGAPSSLPTISTLDGGVIILSNGSGSGGATFTLIDYTQQDSQGGGGYTWVVANQATTTAGTYNTEYDASSVNRSSLLAYSLNELGSVGVGISDVNSTNPIKPGDTNIVITGTSFEASQGTGVITVSPTDNISDTNAIEFSTVDSWADTSIQFDLTDPISLLYGTVYVFVTNDSAETNANGFTVTLNPKTTNEYLTIAAQHDDGVLNGVTGIIVEADQIEWQKLSAGGGTVHIDLSGTFSIRDYAGSVPAIDTLYVRLGDKSDESWSSTDMQAIGINQTVSSGSDQLVTSLVSSLVSSSVKSLIK